MSRLEDTLATQLRFAGLDGFKREVRPIPGRRFRFDFAFLEPRLLIEVQGGTWAMGAHSTGQGISRDTEKLNLATIHGWRVLQFTTDQIRQGKALRWVQAALAGVA